MSLLLEPASQAKRDSRARGTAERSLKAGLCCSLAQTKMRLFVIAVV